VVVDIHRRGKRRGKKKKWQGRRDGERGRKDVLEGGGDGRGERSALVEKEYEEGKRGRRCSRTRWMRISLCLSFRLMGGYFVSSRSKSSEKIFSLPAATDPRHTAAVAEVHTNPSLQVIITLKCLYPESEMKFTCASLMMSRVNMHV
jgi:hypothetical protein